MSLENAAKQIMLDAFGTNAVRCRLYDETQTELSGEGYAEQTISWTYDSIEIELNADNLAGEDYIAKFDVPAGTIKYVGFLQDDIDNTLLAMYDLGENAEAYTNPGAYRVSSAKLQLDVAP